MEEAAALDGGIGKQFREAGKRLKGNLGQLLLFELLYKGLFALFMLPLMELFLRFAIRCSGYSYVTPENVLRFLARPTTGIPLFVLLVLFLLFAFVEADSLFLFFLTDQKGQRPEAVKILLYGVRHVWSVLKRKGIGGVAVGTCFFSLVSNVPFWIGCYFRFPVVRALLSELWGRPLLRAAFLVTVSLLFLAGFFSFFFLQYYCFLGTSFTESIRRSLRVFVRQPGLLGGSVVFWNGFCFLAEAFFYLLVLFLVTVAAYALVPERRLIVVLLRLEDVWNLCGGMLASTVGLVANAALVTGLSRIKPSDYVREGRRQEGAFCLADRGRHRLLLALIGLIILGNIVNMTLLWRNGSLLQKEVLRDIAVTAHRGASAEAPENTLSALRLAIEDMAEYAEIDVQETRDGVVVLLHDYSLKRTTGRKQYLWNVTYEELMDYDCGGWFSDDYAGEHVPTLREVLELCKGRIDLNIELKASAHSQSLEEKVVALIEEYGFENQCVLTSTSAESLRRVKERNPSLKTGYIMSIAYGNFYERQEADFFSIRAAFVDERVVSAAHRAGKEVHVWTVNSRNELERMKALGVDNIITDRPLFAREILEEGEISSSLFELLKMALQH